MRSVFQRLQHKPPKAKEPKIGLALQGGGSYGAFTKGVLKALLEDGIITADNLKAVSGTSAGAKNATLLVDGLTSGSPQTTIEKLDDYWHDVGRTWARNSKTPFPLLNMFLPAPVTSRSYPNLTYEFQRVAANTTPPSGYMMRLLKNQLKKHVTSWRALKSGPIKLFVNAVKVDPKTGEREHKVFTGSTLSASTVPLSANLHEFGATEHRGMYYYDGAYWRNPCFDGVTGKDISDLIVITIQKHPDRPAVIRSQDEAREQHDNPGHEIMGEEIHDHMAWLSHHKPHLNLHEIRLDVQPEWDDSSRMNADPQWLEELSEKGYKTAKQWIKDNRHLLGAASSYKTTHDAANDNETLQSPKQRREPV